MKSDFEGWEALGLCQNKQVRLGSAIRWYCEIWEANENKIPRSPVVVEAWRAQVLWVN